jgi:peroxiredoxin
MINSRYSIFRVFSVAAMVGAALIGSIFARAAFSDPQAPAAQGPLSIGSSAPSFSLPNVETLKNESLKSLSHKKKATVIIFIATQCPVSNAYNERMEALASSYSTKKVAFIGINSNETEPIAECAAHAEQHKFTFPVLKDAGSKIADLYSARYTPEVFVLDSKGAIVYHGRIDNSRIIANVTTHELSDALDSILAGKPVEKSETKAFGCTIKRPETQS